MDSARLATALSFLNNDEKQFEIQPKLEALRDALANLASNPGEASYQQIFVSRQKELRRSLADCIATYNNSQREQIYELGAKPYFSTSLTNRIQGSVSSNPLSPAVTLELVTGLIEERQAFLLRVRNVLKGLQSFDLSEDEKPVDAPDIGFEIPRTLFDNELTGLVRELNEIRRIIRVISEVTTGQVTEIELHDISASDPLFFFGIDYRTIITLGSLFSWSILQWKAVEQIREIRARTSKIKGIDKSDIEDLIDKKITETIDGAIAKKSHDLIDKSPLIEPRKNEIDDQVSSVIRSIFSKFERGMKIEIRGEISFSAEELEDENAVASVKREFEKFQNIVFPSKLGEPVMPLLPGKTDGIGEVDKP